MADDATHTIQSLHKQWRGGDAAAGQAMAQVFTDWSFAVFFSRLGDGHFQEPWRRACHAFAQGVRELGRNAEIVDWAHEIVRKELETAGGRQLGADNASPQTGNRAPSALLAQAGAALLPVHVRLLTLAYGANSPLEEAVRLAEDNGGWPFAVLEARYALKRWLRDEGRVPLNVVPATPNLDRGPLPLYEAGRMETADEETFFEKWLISDMDLCHDVAEFAPFTHALRAGALKLPAAPPPVAPPTPREAPRAAEAPPRPAPVVEREEAAPASPPASQTWMAVGAVVMVLVLVVVLLVYFLDT